MDHTTHPFAVQLADGSILNLAAAREIAPRTDGGADVWLHISFAAFEPRKRKPGEPFRPPQDQGHVVALVPHPEDPTICNRRAAELALKYWRWRAAETARFLDALPD